MSCSPGTERVRRGDFSHRIRVTTQDQLGELAGSFNAMTDSIADLLKQAKEKRRLEEELRIAREIQMSLLPSGPLTFPGLAITAMCRPAREVGGDYYEFLPLGDHRLGVLVADVSGKGTSAAFYMAELKGLILSLSQIYQSPKQLLMEVNRILSVQPARQPHLHHDDLRGGGSRGPHPDLRAGWAHPAHLCAGRWRCGGTLAGADP